MKAILVPLAGLEPAQLASPASETGVSTCSTTRALIGAPNGTRTRIFGLKGRPPKPLAGWECGELRRLFIVDDIYQGVLEYQDALRTNLVVGNTAITQA